MAYSLVIKPLAEKDIDNALEWYNERGGELAIDLYNKIDECFARIVASPEMFQKKYKAFRIVFTERFSYGIHYTIEGNFIFVHAVTHTSKMYKL